MATKQTKSARSAPGGGPLGCYTSVFLQNYKKDDVLKGTLPHLAVLQRITEEERTGRTNSEVLSRQLVWFTKRDVPTTDVYSHARATNVSNV